MRGTILLIVVFAAMNIGFIFNSLGDLWRSQIHTIIFPLELAKPRVCVLVSGGGNASGLLSSLAESIEGDFAFSYGVFLASRPTLWHRFPPGTLFHYVPTNSSENSTLGSLLFSAGVKGCSFLFTVGSDFRFRDAGWATVWVKMLRALHPPYVGAVIQHGDSVFVHSVHLRIFHRHYPLDDICWVRWIQSVYGMCRVVNYNNNNHRMDACPPFSARGRLRVAKFLLALGPDYIATAACQENSYASMVVDV